MAEKKGEIHADLGRSQDLLQSMLRCAHITWVVDGSCANTFLNTCMPGVFTVKSSRHGYVRHQICSGRAAKRFYTSSECSTFTGFSNVPSGAC